MTEREATASYVELSSQAYSLFVDAVASANQRSLDYWKSVWEIASRPYSSASVEATVRENFDRANQMVSLTVGELQTNGKQAAELAEKLFAHGAKMQDSFFAGFRGLMDTSISNMNYVRESATTGFDDLSKRLDDIQRRTASVSNN